MSSLHICLLILHNNHLCHVLLLCYIRFYVCSCLEISRFKFDWNNHPAHSDTTVARMLVGNKCDLDNIRAVSVEEGTTLAEAEGLFFMETSALDSTNVKKAFEIVIREIYNNVSRKVLNSDTYKAELSVNRVTLVNNNDGSKQNPNLLSCCSRWSLL